MYWLNFNKSETSQGAIKNRLKKGVHMILSMYDWHRIYRYYKPLLKWVYKKTKLKLIKFIKGLAYFFN